MKFKISLVLLLAYQSISAFDLSTPGLEFGHLEFKNINLSTSQGDQVSLWHIHIPQEGEAFVPEEPDSLILNEGDVVMILNATYNDEANALYNERIITGNSSATDYSYLALAAFSSSRWASDWDWEQNQTSPPNSPYVFGRAGDYFTGPGTLYAAIKGNYDNVLNGYVTISYAVLRAAASTTYTASDLLQSREDGQNDVIANPNNYNLHSSDEISSVQTELTAAIAERDARLTMDEVRDARVGSTMIEVSEGKADITMTLEETSDLTDWSSAETTDKTIQVDAPAGVRFYRFKMTE
jgi:hypothetical protein